MFKKLKNYNPKIKLTIKINRPNFLDTEIIISSREVATSVHVKESKLPVPWESIVSNHYERNNLLDELKRYLQIFRKKLETLKKNLVKQSFH